MLHEVEDDVPAKSTTIDESLERYRIKIFKNTNAKRVPHEEIDYNIYKSSHVEFSTTTKRLPIWIKALFTRYNVNQNGGVFNTRWLEQESKDNPTKCDKILLNLLTNDENILAITINVTAGRIKVQGRVYKEWGANEFDELLVMVNSPQDTWKIDNEALRGNLMSKDNNPEPSQTPNKPKQSSPEETTPNTPRDRTFSQIKSQVANLEAEFVLHKENTDQTISKLSQSIETKDKEIGALKKKENDKQQLSDQ